MFLSSSTLASLRFFVAAARAASFKKAATELHVTQGAVSQQIKHLEAALGTKLFHRLTRQISLTEEGQRFFVTCERALDDIESSAQAIATTHSSFDIRLRAGPSFSLRWLVPRLGDFYARHTGIRLFVNASYGLFDPARRDFDLAIELIKGQPSGLHSELLMEEYLLPVCSVEYFRAHGFLKNPKDLEHCNLLHDAQPWAGAQDDAEWRFWLKGVGAEGVHSNRGQFFSLSNMSIEAALTHQGVAIGRASLVKELIESAQLVAPFKRRVKSPTKYHLVYPKELATKAGMQIIIRWLREQAVLSGSA
jgi:LysR family glycine cleavage system transcriptional activator